MLVGCCIVKSLLFRMAPRPPNESEGRDDLEFGEWSSFLFYFGCGFGAVQWTLDVWHENDLYLVLVVVAFLSQVTDTLFVGVDYKRWFHRRFSQQIIKLDIENRTCNIAKVLE